MMMGTIRHGYTKDRLGSNLQNFRKTFFKNTLSKSTINRVHSPVVRYKYWWLASDGV